MEGSDHLQIQDNKQHRTVMPERRERSEVSIMKLSQAHCHAWCREKFNSPAVLIELRTWGEGGDWILYGKVLGRRKLTQTSPGDLFRDAVKSLAEC